MLWRQTPCRATGEEEAYEKHVKKTAVFLAAALLCEAVMPVSALEENVKKQLEAVKSLADLDLDSNAAAIQILLQQCMDLLPDGDPVEPDETLALRYALLDEYGIEVSIFERHINSLIVA